MENLAFVVVAVCSETKMIRRINQQVSVHRPAPAITIVATVLQIWLFPLYSRHRKSSRVKIRTIYFQML